MKCHFFNRRNSVIFELNKEQKQIKKAVIDFVKGEFKKDVIHDLIQKHEYPKNIWKKTSDLGLPGIAFPETYQGEGLGTFEKILIAEELCRGDASIGSCLVHAGYGTEILLQYGGSALKDVWLPQIAGAKILSSVAFAEPDEDKIADSRTTAMKDGSDWIIDGIKTFVKNAGPLAGFYVVLCRTDSSATTPELGLSMILVEGNHFGVATTDSGAKLGQCLLSTGDVRFSNVRVSNDNLVGKENQGYRQLLDFFNHSRLLIAAQSVGIAQGAFDRAFSYVKQREQFGRKIIDFQITRHKLADMATEIEAARLLTYQGAWTIDNGRLDARLCAMAKLHATRTAVAVCDEAIQLLGGYGYMQEYEVERFFRDAKTADMTEGNRHVQKNVISESLIGKNNSFP